MDLLLSDARVWASPAEPVSEPTTVLIRDGVVAHIGEQALAPAPANVVAVDGRVVCSGFWNCHVHLTGGKWQAARRGPAAVLQAALDDTFLSRGFTSVLDLSSNPTTTMPLIRRIESGELRGPGIMTAGSGIRPWRGIPFYVRDDVPWFLRWLMPGPATAAGARAVVALQARSGATITKLFSGSYVEPTRVKPMRLRVAQAAVDAAHRRGMRVFAHPSNREGTAVAVNAGVDALAHVPDETEGTEGLLREAARRDIHVIPTLHMFASTVTTDESYLAPIRGALRGFIDAGGHVLFGTDVGYMPDTETRGEYAAMHASGMDAADILRSLTSAPERFFGRRDGGTIRVGNRADLTILRTRGMPGPEDFADIHAVIKHGRLVFPSADS
ncbi:amidohydrolase family protein [Gryllotalpicola reticulitermitis]|uniref:Amidohydrolase family protein n=1 Tax=Gryllotalpicola reticulitermitis TaxID=1184153 RepID=A0ABV8Q2G1_9MICO